MQQEFKLDGLMNLEIEFDGKSMITPVYINSRIDDFSRMNVVWGCFCKEKSRSLTALSGLDPNISLMVIRNACYVLPYGWGQWPS